MTDSPSPLLIGFISAASAILATLLTIIVTPTLQHHFWKHQRREELRLATINEINRITSEFVGDYLLGLALQQQSAAKMLKSLYNVNAQVRALFSIDTALVYGRLMAMIRPSLGQELLDGRVSLDEFLETRNLALLALYEETGIIPHSKKMRRVLEQLVERARSKRTAKSDSGHHPGATPPP